MFLKKTLLDFLKMTSPESDLSMLASISAVIGPVCLHAIELSDGSEKSRLASMLELCHVTPVTMGSCNASIFISLVVNTPSDTSPTSLSLQPDTLIMPALIANTGSKRVRTFAIMRTPFALLRHYYTTYNHAVRSTKCRTHSFC